MQTDIINSFDNKSDVEKALLNDILGPLELKRDEKRYYLGEFMERVIKLLTKKQVLEPGIYPEIVESIKDTRSIKILINGDLDGHIIEKYQNLAKQLGKRYTVIHDPEFKGDTGLIVVSNEAVEVGEITVEDREIKFAKLGIPVALVNYAGKKLCDECLDRVLSAAPEESINYEKLTYWDRFWGEHCPSCAEK